MVELARKYGKNGLVKCEFCEEYHWILSPYKSIEDEDARYICRQCWNEIKAKEREKEILGTAREDHENEEGWENLTQRLALPAPTVTGMPIHTGITHGTSTTPTTSVPVVTYKPKPQCESPTCYTVVEKEGQYCQKCGAFYDMIDHFNKSYVPGTKVWDKRSQKLKTKYPQVSDTALLARRDAWYIDVDMLRQYCTAPEEWFHTLEGAQHNAQREYTFFDNGSDILFVGHLDKASGSMDRRIFAFFEGKDDDNHYVYNGNLDDRLGVFIGHYVLPTMFGIKCDVLLTTNEERGGTTAREFQEDWLALPEEKRKKYKWGIEFDRRGREPVMYQYETEELRERIEEFIKTTSGTFSDISVLDEMGCKFINWSTGYYNEHSQKHHANLEDTIDVVEAFVAFYEKYKDEHMPHEPMPKTTRYHSRWNDEEEWAWQNWKEAYTNSTSFTCAQCKETHYTKNWVSNNGVTKAICNYCAGVAQRVPSTTKKVLWCRECAKRHTYLINHKNSWWCFECLSKELFPVTNTNPVDHVVVSDNGDGTYTAEEVPFAEVEIVCDGCRLLYPEDEITIQSAMENLCKECYDRYYGDKGIG